MAAIPLEQIKAIVKETSKQEEICDTLHDILIADTEEKVIEAGVPLIVTAYPYIIDDIALTLFDQPKLNAQGVYSSGTYTLSNPDEIYVLSSSTVTVNLSGTAKCNIIVMGSATLIINAQDDSYVKVRCYGSPAVTANVINNAIVEFDVQRDNCTINATMENNTVGQFLLRHDCTLNLTLKDFAFANLRAFDQAVANVTKLDHGDANAKQYQAAKIVDYD